MAAHDDLLRTQSGVISRRQALACGLLPHDLRRLLRTREWVPAHPGVYVDHTGPLTWTQRAWVAVLAAWPAALCRESALRAGLAPQQRDRPDGAPIHVAVARKRTLAAPAGVVLHPTAAFPDHFLAHTAPPRQRWEEAALDLAAGAASDMEAVAVLADIVQTRRTTAPRLQGALAARARVERRGFLSEVLDDIGSGTTSVLERAFLNDVVRRHGLPEGHLQSPDQGLVRDVEHADLALVLELDGRLFHSGARAWDTDRERDLDALVSGDVVTVRLSWGQVVERSCATAAKLAHIMRRRGWVGRLTPCPRCPVDAASPLRRDLVPPDGTQPRHSA